MDDFSFYLRLAKPLVVNLSSAKDRTTAAQWLKKLCDVNARQSDPESDNVHVEFLKLLLYVMQGKRLTGILEKSPPEGSLHDLLQPGQRKATDMISLVKGSRTFVSCVQKTQNNRSRIVTSIGGDMCEYVAVQEIPNFGIHGYYALSTEPLPKWWNPRSSASPEAQISSKPCYKNTCESAGANGRDSMEDLEIEKSKEAKRSDGTIILGQDDAEARNEKSSKKSREKTTHSEKSLRKIFQAQRSEVAGVETRPCWGRSRYIDRLIDESPHLVGDLDLSEADALLHLYRDRKLMKVPKTGHSSAKNAACAISSRRRQVEARLDLPPCAPVPYEDDPEPPEKESRTCFPRKIESDCMDEVRRGNYDRCCLSENEEYYPTDPIESVGSVSLRGGSDDTGLTSLAGCCRGRRGERDPVPKDQPPTKMPSRGHCPMKSSQPRSHEEMNVDREIAEATALASGKCPFDETNSGNFAWVKKDVYPFLNDHKKLMSMNLEASNGKQNRCRESNRNDPGCSRSRGCGRRGEQTYGQQDDRCSPGKATSSRAKSQKTIRRSKAASPAKPGVIEDARLWKEIHDLEDTMQKSSRTKGYDPSSCCGCRDPKYGSEKVSRAPGRSNWRDFAYGVEGEEIEEDPFMIDTQGFRASGATTSSADANALREDIQRLVTDPRRRGPPSRGKVKAPRQKPPSAADRRNIQDENWDPPGHSTAVDY